MTDAEMGWVDFVCPAHGWLAAGPITASVACRCGRTADQQRRGRKLSARQRTLAEKRVIAQRG